MHKKHWDWWSTIANTELRNFSRCVDWSQGVAPLCVEDTALNLNSLNLLLVRKDGIILGSPMEEHID